ncbi:MAG TPA: sensor histidine kinase [Gaiellales bacterium]|nr:sensor histidine kinase [Gaiellales bacterium]
MSTPHDRIAAADREQFDLLRERLVRLEEAVKSSERDRLDAVARLLEAERLERRRIAGELHDDTVQVLTAAMISLDRIGRLAPAGPVHELLDEMRSMLAAATERTRLLTFELRPPRLAKEGLARAVADLAEQAARDACLNVTIDLDGTRHGFVVEEIAYRTFQELISNVRKHAVATEATIALHLRGGVLVGMVSDNGRGFHVDRALQAARRRMHMGLAAMEERLELAGGSVSISSQPPNGTTIEFRLPAVPGGTAAGTPDYERAAGYLAS